MQNATVVKSGSDPYGYWAKRLSGRVAEISDRVRNHRERERELGQNGLDDDQPGRGVSVFLGVLVEGEKRKSA